MFSYAATLEVSNVSVAVLNLDHGRWGHELVARIEGAPSFTTVHHLSGRPEIAPLVNRQKVLAAVTIDTDFSRRIEAGLPASLQVILDGRRSNAAQIVNGYVAAI